MASLYFYLLTLATVAGHKTLQRLTQEHQQTAQERNSLYNIIDGLFAKKKLKDNLTSLIAQ